MKKVLFILPLLLLLSFSSAQAQTCTLEDNLELYLKLDTDSTDSVASYDFTDTNVSYTTGIQNGAGDYNGSSSYSTLSSPPAIDGTSAFTFVFWAKIDTYQAQNIFTYFINGSNKIQIQPYSGYLYFQRGNQYIEITGFSDTVDFHQFAITYDGTDIRAYIDGTLEGSPVSSGSYSVSSPSLVLGYNGSSGFFNGKIDEFAYYSRQLSTDEINLLYNEAVGLTYPLCEASPSPSPTPTGTSTPISTEADSMLYLFGTILWGTGTGYWLTKKVI